MSITYTCGCTDPATAYLVEYECPDFGDFNETHDMGVGTCIVTASMCELHALRQFALGEVMLIRRLGEQPLTPSGEQT